MAEKTKVKTLKEMEPTIVFLGDDKISKANSDQLKDFISKGKKKTRQKKLDKSLDKQGYKPTLETQAGTKVSAFDNTNKIRAGLKKGGRAGYKGGKSVKKKGGAAIRGRSKILR